MPIAGHLPEYGQERLIRPLLDYLAGEDFDGEISWEDWRVSRVSGGRNNLIYRARDPQSDLAIKFTVPDDCDRAGREFSALAVLKEAGLSVAPEPILLDRSRYAQPVVVQSWLAGEVNTRPPASTTEWQRLVEHLALVHTVIPGKTSLSLKKSRKYATSAQEGKEIVRQEVARIPREWRAPALQALLEQLDAAQFPEWPAPQVTLCRLDNNIANYVQRPGKWASVDWEYSGWGDPAFDVANLLTHVAYMDVPTSSWGAAARLYCGLAQDEPALIRIQAYCQILVVWWVVRLARYLYELPRGLGRRLVDWAPSWQPDIEAKYRRYLRLAGQSGSSTHPWGEN